MTEQQLYDHICKMAEAPGKGLQPPFAPVAIPLHPDEPLDYEAVRDEAYAQALGPSDFVHHPSMGAPHVDVFRYPPSGERSYWCYLTNGVSDFPLQLPDGSYFRLELLAATQRPSDVAALVLHRLGIMPFAFSTFLHYFHTVPFPEGLPCAPYTYALTIPPFLADGLQSIPLGPDNSITLVQVIPITELEREFAGTHGSRALVDRLPDLLTTWLFDGRTGGA